MGGNMLDNIYLSSAVPLANVAPDFSHFGSTIPRGVTAAIGTANKVACHVTDYAGQKSSGALSTLF